jgi:imidazolonepropionase-like amidohydrolase
VTTVFDPHDASGDAFTRRARVATGELPGPRIFTTGPIHTVPDGHPIAIVDAFAPWWIRWYARSHVAVAVANAEEARASIDRLAADGADAIKIVVDRIPLDGPRLRREIIAEIVAAAKARGLRVVAHIGTLEDAVDAADGGVAAWMHGVYKERIPDEAIAKLTGYGIPMVATLEVFDRYARATEGPWQATRLERETIDPALLASFYPPPDDFDPGPLEPWLEQVRALRAAGTPHDNVRRLHAAGVTILAGSDPQSGVFPGPGLHRELRQLVAAGLTPAEAIRAATLDAARFIEAKAEPDFGVIAEGRRADLLLVAGDPTADVVALEDIRALFQAGVPIERSTQSREAGAEEVR